LAPALQAAEIDAESRSANAQRAPDNGDSSSKPGPHIAFRLIDPDGNGKQ
jgi:hypothetical protein